MKNTIINLCESDFGLGTSEYMKNANYLKNMDFISEEVREITGYTPEKVNVLKYKDKYYIEYANNLERFMQDSGYNFVEALDCVTCEYAISSYDVNIIVEESCLEKINIKEMIDYIGKDHILRK